MDNYSYRLLGTTLVCTKRGNKIRLNEALNFLVNADSLDNKLYMQGNKLIIRNKEQGYEIEIHDPASFINNGYGKYIRHTIDTVKQNASIIKRNELKDKMDRLKKTIKTMGGAVVVVSALSAACLAGTQKNKELDNEYSAKIEYISNLENKTIEQELNENPKIEEQVQVNRTRYEDVLTSVEAIEASNAPIVDLDIEDNSKNPEIVAIQEEFRDECVKAGERWGISPDVLEGILTQESHGNEANLTQIEFDAWEGQRLYVYNFEEGRELKAVFTDNPDLYRDCEIKITRKDILDKACNVKSCALILNHIAYSTKSNNIFAILDEYNKGAGNERKNMEALEAGTNKTIRQVLDDPTDIDIINYAHVCNKGDENYVCNVMQYIPNAEKGGIYFYRMTEEGKKLINVKVNRTLNNTLEQNENTTHKM